MSEYAAKIHELKCWPEFFEPVHRGVKNFELRKNDRDFQVDDILRLREYSMEHDEYTGREVWLRVTYICRHGVWLKPGYCCMSIEPIEQPE